MVSKVIYRVTAIRAGGGTITREFKGAPSEIKMFPWAVATHNAAFVVRYYPTKKGWIIHDFRRANPIVKSDGIGRNYPELVGVVRSKKTYATEDAAVMVAIHLLNQPQQGEMFDPGRPVPPHGSGPSPVQRGGPLGMQHYPRTKI